MSDEQRNANAGQQDAMNAAAHESAEGGALVYLASPYTPLEGESVQERVDAACRHAAALMSEGYVVFSPIAHSHYIADHLEGDLRMDHEFWMRQDLAILRHCDKVIVLRLRGWALSRGIARELAEARRLGIPVEYRDA